jgi:hypothetical protein
MRTEQRPLEVAMAASLMLAVAVAAAGDGSATHVGSVTKSLARSIDTHQVGGIVQGRQVSSRLNRGTHFVAAGAGGQGGEKEIGRAPGGEVIQRAECCKQDGASRVSDGKGQQRGCGSRPLPAAAAAAAAQPVT